MALQRIKTPNNVTYFAFDSCESFWAYSVFGACCNFRHASCCWGWGRGCAMRMAERRSEGWVGVMPSATGYYLHYLLSTDRTTHTVLANECYMLGVQDLRGAVAGEKTTGSMWAIQSAVRQVHKLRLEANGVNASILQMLVCITLVSVPKYGDWCSASANIECLRFFCTFVTLWKKNFQPRM